MYDVYLGGVTTSQWREDFKTQISSDISIFDPHMKNFSSLDTEDRVEQVAREFYFMDQSSIVVFYFNSASAKSVRVQLGDAVGRGKQVVVCFDGKVKGKTFLRRYCEYRGILIAHSIEGLVSTIEECIAEVELCSLDDD